jgi:hypothetical protein
MEWTRLAVKVTSWLACWASLSVWKACRLARAAASEVIEPVRR